MTILSKQYPMDLGTGSIEQVRQSAPKIDMELGAIYGHLNNIRTRYRSATAPTNPEAGQVWEDTVNAKVMKWNGSAWVEDIAKSVNLTNRNTVLQGQVSSAGALELILGSTSTLTADLVSSAVDTIIAIPAGHDDVMGNSDYIVSFSTTQTDFWTSLPGTNTSYLFVDYSGGTVTGVYSVIAPVYQSYAPAHSAGKNWFDTNKDQWYLSDGSNWVAKYRVYVGSVVTDGTKVTATTIEPYNVLRSAVPMSYLDTDGTLAANSDKKIATQKAIKEYVAANAVGAGSVIQVVSTAKTDTFSVDATGVWRAITGLSVKITPKSASSKILVMFTVNGVSSDFSNVRLLRGSTPICIGDASSARSQSSGAQMYLNVGSSSYSIVTSSNNFLDSPATIAEVEYKLECYGGTFYINRTQTDGDIANAHRSASTITVMEVKG